MWLGWLYWLYLVKEVWCFFGIIIFVLCDEGIVVLFLLEERGGKSCYFVWGVMFCIVCIVLYWRFCWKSMCYLCFGMVFIYSKLVVVFVFFIFGCWLDMINKVGGGGRFVVVSCLVVSGNIVGEEFVLDFVVNDEELSLEVWLVLWCLDYEFGVWSLF